MGKRNEYRLLMGKPEGKRHLERPRHRWEDDIKLERGLGTMGWNNLAQHRNQLGALVNLRVP
jgi:hypothetical protein